MKNIIFLFLLVLFAGCAEKQKVIQTGSGTDKIDAGKSIYLSVPKDGTYGLTVYHGSGVDTSRIIFSALANHSNKLCEANEYHNFDHSLESAKNENCDYLIFPTILEWDDRATEWSGIPDNVSVKIDVIEISTGRTIDSVIIKEESETDASTGGHPQDLLPQPVKQYIDSLFQ